MSRPEGWLRPDWPAPARIKACVTTRWNDGVSQPPFERFNLADHVGDQPMAVQHNRMSLQRWAGCRPAWLQQVHGIDIVKAEVTSCPVADASWTDIPGIACSILTADCLPVLFCDRAATRVAAAHAGWRGLAAGVLERCVQALALPGSEILAWLGPAIGPRAFEVGAEVYEAFVSRDPACRAAFVPAGVPGKYWADLYRLARLRLAGCGVTAVYGGGFCTLTDQRFYSYRRSKVTGRFASLIWLDSH